MEQPLKDALTNLCNAAAMVELCRKHGVNDADLHYIETLVKGAIRSICEEHSSGE